MPFTARAILLASVLIVGPWTGVRSADISMPTFMVGGSSRPDAASCTQEFEGVAAATTNANSPTAFVAALGRGQFTRSLDTWDNWDLNTPANPAWNVPLATTGPRLLSNLRGDAWSTFSATNNLVYVSYIGRPATGVGSCFALAAGR